MKEKYKAELNNKNQELIDYKAKSNKVLRDNENHYNKVLKDYEKVKKELSQLLNKYNNDNSHNNIHEKKMPTLPNIQPSSIGIDWKLRNFDVNQRISKEYLKNALLKYLEAIAIGNEFETKILENVLFTVLQVIKNEINYLEDKRITSSFYYNLWYNAKSFISSKIYGETKADGEEKKQSEENGEVNNINNNNIEQSDKKNIEKMTINK